ncbi:hypothetical protein M2323_000766 [Rhodoblastus acidophilus]|uniref:hypothetical protein n=1 Tax=Rhodoblastus acidophilus TaxID=1074 RepID=UPI002224CE9D|nr:hypothetical protein [Rhodoblastus acidophilus]MCW2283087.1 hypothetical protein [Rhodoblastus acidophilus]MCW2331862.1 hypothetical protein [Rhodoblastus acidophilus]
MSAPLINRRLLLLGALSAPAFAAPSPKRAEIAFQVDDARLRALFARRLRESLERMFGATFFAEISAEPAGLTVKLRRPEDVEKLEAAVARLPGEPKLGGLKGGVVRLDWSAAALDAQARIWRDRAKKMLEKPLNPRKPVFTDKDDRNFVLGVEGMDRAQWLAWIGARIDLFFPATFSMAPVVPAGPTTFAPRAFPHANLSTSIAVDPAKWLGDEDDIFRARADGDKIVLELTRPGADLFASKNLPGADKTAYALMFDKALAALCALDGPARDGVMTFRIERGLGAAELAELIAVGGSAPAVKQVDARFT